MATPEYNHCDKCKKGKSPLDLRIHVTTDREMDGAGSMDDVSFPLDLCHSCAMGAIKLLLRNPDNPRVSSHAAGKRLEEWVKAN